ncbi:hypothetical protein HD553DRAFT_327264 [Filobasidium floriforme]|uniref:uncharacterized protein n=1 Tax=Filobasidium floriforme TaxID=5210 RepID=UPI001E8CE076|nr:uncharacterized protein HD553DRAFT_327264 [Filobasidium floriforme]KAH8077667.1 hypothetical protein HD553DRAFT_327264 [Filobasidium floriforme]
MDLCATSQSQHLSSTLININTDTLSLPIPIPPMERDIYASKPVIHTSKGSSVDLNTTKVLIVLSSFQLVPSYNADLVLLAASGIDDECIFPRRKVISPQEGLTEERLNQLVFFEKYQSQWSTPDRSRSTLIKVLLKKSTEKDEKEIGDQATTLYLFTLQSAYCPNPKNTESQDPTFSLHNRVIFTQRCNCDCTFWQQSQVCNYSHAGDGTLDSLLYAITVHPKLPAQSGPKLSTALTHPAMTPCYWERCVAWQGDKDYPTQSGRHQWSSSLLTTMDMTEAYSRQHPIVHWLNQIKAKVLVLEESLGTGDIRDFLSVSESKQVNWIIGLVIRKKGGDAWVPLLDVNDNMMMGDITSVSVLDDVSSILTTISCDYMY